MQRGFYFDQSRCIGCFACVAACRSWKGFDPAAPDLVRIVTAEQGEYPDVSLTNLFLTCFHCAQPACVDACPGLLLVKRPEDGVVIITDSEQCTNCQLCLEACPYEAPKPSSVNDSMVKCDLCLDRLSEGKAPACVATCPTQALDAGPMDELVAKYNGFRELEGFADYRQTDPSIIFRSGKKGKPR